MPLDASYHRAVIAYANYAQFGPAQVIHNGPVGSRMLLWCRAGTGQVTANKQKLVMEAGRFLILPWGHTIRYEASQADPFLLAGIHIVPHHATNHAVEFIVPHNARHPLANVAWRRDARLPGIPEFAVSRLAPGSALAHLLEHIVGVFVRSTPPEWLARQLTGLVLHELATTEHANAQPAAPPELERLQQFVEFHMREPVSLCDLAEFAKLSPATVGRLFRKHLKTTPVTWILQVKMERARQLMRTRRLNVTEVAHAVGFTDPYYFSKCFRKITGRSPLAYRKQQHWL